MLVEDVLWGYDVLASAVHLTASTLALLSPGVSFKHMNLQVLPLGGAERMLGSVEFLTTRELAVQQNLFGAAQEAIRVTGTGAESVVSQLPDLDLAVMNPPFTRSVGGSLLFGSRPQPERRAMQKRLSAILKTHSIDASSTAGLGPVFVAVAHRAVKEGGRQALVLPRSLVSGVAWAPTRRLLSSHYHVETVISSHDPERWNFSENTSLSESLTIARKDSHIQEGALTAWVNLWRNPRSMVEAAALADCIARMTPAALDGPGVTEIRPDGRTWGEIFTTPTERLSEGIWHYHAFAQTELVRVASRLQQGELWIPPSVTTHPIKLRPLGELGAIGPDRRDIHDGFVRTPATTPYSAVWGGDSEAHQTLTASVDAHLQPRATAAAGRPLRPLALLWPRAGTLLLSERLRINTRRIIAAHVSKPVLSNVWWPVRVNQDRDLRRSRTLALWLNSTLGILLALWFREETEGAWIALKKPILEMLPVPDLDNFSDESLSSLAASFDALALVELRPIPELVTDPGRRQIDDAISLAFGLPDLGPLRTILAREPILSQESLFV